ncbi:MAG: signal recognition particle-docking protein FtsY [Clostridia bacterium]|nr:signal recognition particle-docking protein FtsY [Clostridia bacterium]
MGFFSKLKDGLLKTKNAFVGQMNEVVKSFRKVDEDLLEELEEIMIMADMGAPTTEKVIDELRDRIKTDNIKDSEQVKDVLCEILTEQIGEGEPLNLTTTPSVILVIGVNGVGKTTSIGKIANNLKKQGKRVVVAAADTFRAAAIEQLAIWCDRAGVELIRQNEGSDPASVVFDAIAATNKRKADVLIIDTASRLHNKSNLMDELAKINRIISRELPEAARETLLVLDSTTGQNAVMQAKKFKEAAEITGLVLTKLDGTAKGGAVFSIKNEVDLPVKFIGVGEQIDDMRPFDAKMFVDALLKDDLDEIDDEEDDD